jgi:hypothetical protein
VFSKLPMKSQTSSTGRLTVTLWVIVGIVTSPSQI